MIYNFIKTTFRHLKKYKTLSIINVLGLSVGMAVCLLILLWVVDEISYDRYHVNKNNIHRMAVDLEAGSHMVYPMTAPPLAPLLIQQYPEVVNAVRVERPHRASVRYDEKVFQENGVCHADNALFDIFTFRVLKGDVNTALIAPYTMVITETTAEKYFGDDDPLGKSLRINGQLDYMITAVIKDVPLNSHFRFNMVCSFETLYAQNRPLMENWFHIQFYTYLLFAENTDIDAFVKKMPEFINTHMGSSLEAMGGKLDFFLQPLLGIHLHSKLSGEIAPQGSITTVYLFSGIALFILILACINFINLSTARSSVRAKEIGMRKTVGANRLQLRIQFLTESTVICFLSLFLALFLVSLVLQSFSSIVGRELGFQFLKPMHLLFILTGLGLLVGFVAGSYPALIQSRLTPIKALSGGDKGKRRSRLRNGLVVFQFAISIILIIGTTTITHQIHFMKHKGMGFDQENVIGIPGARGALRQHSLETIRKEFMEVPGILDVGGASLIPSRGTQRAILFPEGFSMDQPQMGEKLFVDAHYISTMGMELTAGRNFSEEMGSDGDETVIINEAAVRAFGWTEPLGKTFSFRAAQGPESEFTTKRVIGVVKDFHSASLHQQIEPLIFYYDTPRIRYITLRLAPGNLDDTLDQLKRRWHSLFPHKQWRYFFLDESIDRMYRSEERFSKIALSFCLLAVLIGCLGLFGLAAFSTEQRTREIGIRKVLGATHSGIVKLISGEFALLIVLANLLAWPVAYWGMQRWLENFAYRAEIGWWIFILAGISGFAVALLTVGYQAIKAALANPADTLKCQ
ncbi:ABC transporter permease [bacterium]|nr:ABC transporter permease [bacterium]